VALNLRPKGRGGPRGLTEAQLEEALRKNAGNVMAAAVALGVSDAAIYQRLRNHPHLAEIKEDAKLRVTDMATANIMKRIQRDDWNATNLWLTTQAGWTKRTELTGEGGVPLQVAPAVHIHVNYVEGTPGPATEEDVV
jgi:hypothetical protein